MNIIVRFKGFFIGVGICVGVFFFTLFTIKPTIEGISATQERINQARARLELLTEKERLLKNVNRGEFSAEVEKLNAAIPQSIDLPLILATLEKIAADTQVELGEFSISSVASAINILPIERAEKLSSFQFKMVLKGTFDNLQQFNEQLHTMSPLLRIDSVEFSADKATILVSFSFQPKSTRKPAIDEPLFAFEAKDKETMRKVSALIPPVLETPELGTPSAGTRGTPFR